MIGQQKVTRIIVVTYMFIWLSGHEVNATTDRRIQARTENGKNAPLRLKSTVAPPIEQEQYHGKVASAEFIAPNDPRATPSRLLPIDERFPSDAEVTGNQQVKDDTADEGPEAEVAQSKRGGKTSGTENQRKPGKDKGRKGSFQKGGRRRGHKNKMPSYASSSSIDEDFVQADSADVRSNSTFFRKEPIHVTAGDKSNDAWRDKGLTSAGVTVSKVTCNEMKCVKGGKCLDWDSSLLGDAVRCQCQLGTKGEFCEKDVVVKYPKFSGSGYIAFPVLRGAFKEFIVDVEFRPDLDSGLLLFSSDHPEARFDFFSVVLIQGHVEFRFDCGTGMGQVRTKNTVELGKWNYLKIYRQDWNGFVKLNDGPEVKGKSKLLGWQYGRNPFGSYQWTYMGPPTKTGNSWAEKWNSTTSDDLNTHRSRLPSSSSSSSSDSTVPFFKPKGVFTKMSFREHLFLGGYRNTSTIEGRTGAASGFSGCVRFLRINQKVYDMRKGAFVGDALYGLDVDECNGHACDKVKCLNGGRCASVGADSSLCLCPLGSIGDRCQSKNDVQIPSFDGHSYLQYIGLRRTVMSFSEIEVVFKTTDPDGLILYNGYSTDGTGDFISLALQNGTVEYRYDLGTGPAIIRSRSPVSLDVWHSIRISRNGRNGQLQLDGEQLVEGSSNGAFTQLTLTLDLFVGGHRNFDEVAKSAGISKSLKGCIQKVVINERALKLLDEALAGVNIDNCPHVCASQPCKNGGHCVPLKDQYQCSCPMGFENTNCQDQDETMRERTGHASSYAEAKKSTARYRYRYRYRRDASYKMPSISVPRFAGDGFLMYTEPEIAQRTRGNKITVQMRVKVTESDGLLFYVGEEGTGDWGDYLAIGLTDGHLQMGYNLGDGEIIAKDNFSRIDDGHWHLIKVERYDEVGRMEVDGKEVTEIFSTGLLKQLNTDGIVYVGGMADVETRTLGRYTSGLYGCIANLTLGFDFHVDLMADADVATNVGQCD